MWCVYRCVGYLVCLCGVCRCVVYLVFVVCVSVCYLSGGFYTEHNTKFFGCCDYLYINTSKNAVQYVTTILLIQKAIGSDTSYLK